MPITPPPLRQYENMAQQAGVGSTLIEYPANG